MSLIDRPIVLLDAPSNLGLKPPTPGKEPGVKHMPDALRKVGLREGLGAMDGGRIEPPPYSPDIDSNTGVRNGDKIPAYSQQMALRVGEILDSDQFPLVLGGDCSILIGSMLALRQRGRYGLVFIDGHTDYLTPETSASKGAAGMDLAIVTGVGAEQLTNINGLKPLIKPEDVIAVGYRDDDEWDDAYRKAVQSSGITLFDLAHTHHAWVTEIAVQIINHMKTNDVQGFWIHLDADVLDDAVMPAVDSRQPGGLSYLELPHLLRLLLASELAVGMEITIFDPDLDADGSIARGFNEAIINSFRSHSDAEKVDYLNGLLRNASEEISRSTHAITGAAELTQYELTHESPNQQNMVEYVAMIMENSKRISQLLDAMRVEYKAMHK